MWVDIRPWISSCVVFFRILFSAALSALFFEYFFRLLLETPNLKVNVFPIPFILTTSFPFVECSTTSYKFAPALKHPCVAVDPSGVCTIDWFVVNVLFYSSSVKILFHCTLVYLEMRLHFSQISSTWKPWIGWNSAAKEFFIISF